MDRARTTSGMNYCDLGHTLADSASLEKNRLNQFTGGLKGFLAGLIALFVLLSSPAFAAHPAEDLIKKMTADLIGVLESPEAKKDTGLVNAAIEKDVLPHIDFELMTKLAVGKPWRSASDQQKKDLVSEFRTLLLNTYTRAVSEYSGQSLEFLPFQAGERADRAVVSTLFKDNGSGLQIPIDYKLREKGRWLVYDIEVESISLVLGYRSEFANQIQKGGVEGLIEVLRKKNAG